MHAIEIWLFCQLVLMKNLEGIKRQNCCLIPFFVWDQTFLLLK